MIELTAITPVRTGVADPAKAVDFATGILGLKPAEPAEPAPGVAHLPADWRHRYLPLAEGGRVVIASGFVVAR